MKKEKNSQVIAKIIIYVFVILTVCVFGLYSNYDESTAKLDVVEEVNEISCIYEEEIVSDSENLGTMVYVTDTGTKYHEYGCRYLRKSCNEIEFENAKNRGYKPCKICE